VGDIKEGNREEEGGGGGGGGGGGCAERPFDEGGGEMRGLVCSRTH